MAVSDLAASQEYVDFFCQSVLEDLPYWQQRLEAKTTDHAIIKRKRDQILKNIQFALDLEGAWLPLQPLIQAFSPYMERWGYWDQWQEVLEYALQVARHLDDKTSEVKLSVLLARLFTWQGRFRDTITNYHHVIRLAHQIGDLENRARAYSNLGFLYAGLGYEQRAEVLCCHALAIFERINYDPGRAHTENHLGFLYIRQRFWEKAQGHLERACTIWQVMDDNHGLMRGFINQGALYNDAGQYDEALSALEAALQYAQRAGEEAEIGKIYLNMGLALGQKGELAQAEAYLWQAEAIFQRFSNSQDLLLLGINLGILYIEQQRWEEAREYLETALTASRHLKNEYGEIEAIQGLVEYELVRGNQPQAEMWLNELKRLVRPFDWKVRHHRLQSLQKKYHRSLPELQLD